MIGHYPFAARAVVRAIGVAVSLAFVPRCALADDVAPVSSGALVTSGAPVAFAGAGSLRAAIVEIAQAYTALTHERVDLIFGPSGKLEQQIEAGELRADIFASADLGNPHKLVAAGRAQTVVPYTRNAVCAIAKTGWSTAGAASPVQTSPLQTALLNPATRIGTSTPGNDPSGDYAQQILVKAGASIASSEPQKSYGLPANALMIYGGFPRSPIVPPATDPVSYFLLTPPPDWSVDVVLTYCSAARAAADANAMLEVIDLPPNLATTADYGYALPSNAGNRAGGARFGSFLLTPQAQAIFATHGFLRAAPRP